MAEVLIGRVHSPRGEELPEDLVGSGPPHKPRLGQEHEVHLGLLVELQDLEDEQPFLEGLIVHPPPARCANLR